jgi:hypothetical protein
LTVTFRHLTIREIDLHTRRSTLVLLRGAAESAKTVKDVMIRGCQPCLDTQHKASPWA